VQVPKSSKHNVAKVKDVEEVQPYLINNEMVLFLNARPQMGKGKPGVYRCDDCDRALLDEAYRFCSLRCKVYTATYVRYFCLHFCLFPYLLCNCIISI
jgi:hypothetical protein